MTTNDEQYREALGYYTRGRDEGYPLDPDLIRGEGGDEYRADFDRFLARVRRDAEAELDSWMARAYEAEGKLWKAEARIVEEKRLRMKATAAATQAEARIKTVEDVLNTVEDGHSTDPVIRGLFPRMVGTALIRRALDG